MNRLLNFFQSTTTSRIVSIVLLVLLVGLTTQAVLSMMYGEIAPLADAADVPMLPVNTTPSVPAWLAGGTTDTAPSVLSLVGVVAQGTSGYALLQIAGKRASLLQVGHSLPDGTKLIAVHGKNATVLQHGIQSTLILAPPNTTNFAISMPIESVTPPVAEGSTQIAVNMQQSMALAIAQQQSMALAMAKQQMQNQIIQQQASQAAMQAQQQGIMPTIQPSNLNNDGAAQTEMSLQQQQIEQHLQAQQAAAANQTAANLGVANMLRNRMTH